MKRTIIDNFKGHFMARADILISLVKSASHGDMPSFRRSVESLIAEERAKKHNILADQLKAALNNGTRAVKTLHTNDRAADLVFEVTPQTNLEDLILDKNVSDICRELIEEQHRADLLHTHGLEPRHRVLLAGPPGNGKTSLAEAIACHLMYPFFVIRYENLIGKYLGETASRLQHVFDYAKTTRCVLFFDEFDTIGKERGDTKETGEIKRVVSSLLLQIDRLPSYVVVITASNHPELLDRAVWRRFQLRLRLPPPDKKQIEAFISKFFDKTGVRLKDNPETISEHLAGLSFGEIEEFCTDVVRQAVLKRKQDNPKAIVAERIRQWGDRFRVDNGLK